MPSRRLHAKRRNGCNQCKARRVKCDAGAPCQHCVRRQEDCTNRSLLSDRASVTPSPPSTSSLSPAALSDTKWLSPAETGSTILGISHLELRLLDHYCSFVAPIISVRDNMRQLWQYEIPQQAKIHPFLMHSVLSASANHLCRAYAEPVQWKHGKTHDVSSVKATIERQRQQSSRYNYLALEQQHLAFRQYIPSLSALTSHNQEALCAASALLTLSALASTQTRYCSPIRSYQKSSPIDDWLEISILVRGVDKVVLSAVSSIVDGVLQPLLQYRNVGPPIAGAESDFESQLQQLVSPGALSALESLSPAIDQCSLSDDDKEILHYALELLRASFAIVAANPEHESMVMVWSNMLDAKFFPFVRRREPMALILLAYWTVLFGTFGDRWWVGGLSLAILRHIADYLTPLDEINEDVRDGNEFTPAFSSPGPGSSESSDSMAKKLKWKDLLEWPLRESEIYEYVQAN